MKKIIILSLLIGIFGVSDVLGGGNQMHKFLGVWGVDFDRTMEAAKKSPKYSEQEAERMPKMIERMMGMMKIKLTDREMIYVRGSREMALPYTVKAASKQSTTVQFSQNKKTFEVQFTLIDGKYMRFTSSGSDDMDYYIWKRLKG